jgi:hypothetical protein
VCGVSSGIKIFFGVSMVLKSFLAVAMVLKSLTLDYILGDRRDRECMSMLLDVENEDDKMVLGTGFLRGVHAVFDLENNMVGCECLNPSFFGN